MTFNIEEYYVEYNGVVFKEFYMNQVGKFFVYDQPYGASINTPRQMVELVDATFIHRSNVD